MAWEGEDISSHFRMTTIRHGQLIRLLFPRGDEVGVAVQAIEVGHQQGHPAPARERQGFGELRPIRALPDSPSTISSRAVPLTPRMRTASVRRCASRPRPLRPLPGSRDEDPDCARSENLRDRNGIAPNAPRGLTHEVAFQPLHGHVLLSIDEYSKADYLISDLI